MKRLFTLLASAGFFISAFAQNDLSVTAMTAPVSGCALTATENVTIKIFNFGNNLPAGTTFNVYYRINAGAPVNELVTLGANLLSNSTFTYTFTTQANLSVPGTYNFVDSVALAGDINTSNNAFTASPVVNTAASVGGTVNGGTDVCISGNAGILTLTGQTGSVTQWEKSTDGGVTWISIANTTTTQSYTNVNVQTSYRADVQNGGCSTATSTIATLTIDPASVGGTVNSSATVCTGANGATLTLTGKTGSVVRWEKSTDGGVTWVIIPNTTTSQAYLNLVTTTLYRVLVKSGSCSSTYSSTATITVRPNSVGGTLNPVSATVCSGSNAGTITLNGHVGNIIRWEKSIDNGVSWTFIANTTTTQNYNNLVTTTLYRVRVQSSPCSVMYSSVDTINVTSATVAGSLSPVSVNECASGNAGTITLSGQAGNVVQWEFSTDGGVTWTVIANTTTTQNYNNLVQTTIYRALVQNGGCTAAYSSTSTINVSPVSVGGMTSPNATVCATGNGGTINLAGQTGTIIDWQSSNDGVTWNALGNTTSSQSYSNLTDTTYYWVIVQSGVCPADTSGIDTITVDPVTVPGTIVPAASTVCSGMNNGVLTLSGDTGSVVQWEYSTDNGVTWIVISNTTTTQSYNNITTATIYRALVKSGVCSQGYSAQATITINQQANGGTLYSDATVCGGTNNGTLTLVGFSGSISQWESSSDNGVTWNPIANTSNTQTYTNLIDTTLYRVIVGSGVCPLDTSTEVTIFVNAPSVGGLVSMDDTVCSGANGGVLSLNGQTGNVTNWEYSTDGGVTWINIANTTTSQAYSNLTQTTKYRVRVGNGVCPTAVSDTATITVDPPLIPGTVSGSTTVCASGNNGTLMLGSYSGTIMTWETSTDSGMTWTPDGNNTANENYTNLTDTTWYHVIVSSGTCGTDTSSVGVIIVDPVPAGGVTSMSDSVCAGMNGATIHLAGDTGSVIRWEFSTDGGNNWMALSNTTDSLTYINLMQTTWYRAVVQSGVCMPAVYSTIDTITVSPPTASGTISGEMTVCPGTGSGTLHLNGYTGAILGWQSSMDGGVTWTPTGNATSSQNWSNPADTTWYEVVVQSGVCPSDTTAFAAINTYAKPVAGFSSNTVCFGNATIFTDTTTISSGGIQFHNWDFGDNNASVATSPVHTYGSSGTFNVSEIVISNFGCSDTANAMVTVNALPSAAITASGNTTLCSGDSIELSVPFAMQNHYNWSTGAIVDSIFVSSTGHYVITVTDTVTGCMAMDSSIVTVLPRPVADAGPDTSISAGTSVVLNGSGGNFYSWSPTVGLSDPFAADPTANPPYNVTYTLTVTSMNGCSDTDAVTVTLLHNENVVISNLITANGDGYNDVWYIKNLEYYPNNKVTIYNRNGMQVFEMENYNNSWAGTYNGQQLPDGTYYYVLKFTDTGDTVKGAVTIISDKK